MRDFGIKFGQLKSRVINRSLRHHQYDEFDKYPCIFHTVPCNHVKLSMYDVVSTFPTGLRALLHCSDSTLCFYVNL